MQILGCAIVLYSWIVAAILLFFLFLIGRFYEIKLGQKSRYQLFFVPLVMLLVAAVWDLFLAGNETGNPLLDFVGEPGPDLLFLAGGGILIGLCYSLYRTMMGGKRQ